MRVHSIVVLPLLSLNANAFVPHVQRRDIGVIPPRTAPTSSVALMSQKRRDDIIEEVASSKARGAASDDGVRKKLITESIAPWRTLRLFTYFSMGSGAALGGFITLSGMAAALSGARTDVDLNTEYLNLAIDFGAAAAFALFAKLDLDKGKELTDNVEQKLQKKVESKEMAKAMEKRAKQLADLSLSIRISGDGELQEAKVKELQSGAQQHMIVVAGPRKAIRDALLGANLMKLSDFAMNNVLVVPYEMGSSEAKVKPSGGFAERPDWETKPYVAEIAGEGWDSYIETEMADAVKQGGEDVKEQGIAIVVANNGKVIRRGVGTVPWKKMVDELNETSKGKKEKEEFELELPF